MYLSLPNSSIIWCTSRSVCGLYFWGRPTADELLAVARVCETYPQHMADKFDVVVDVSGLARASTFSSLERTGALRAAASVRPPDRGLALAERRSSAPASRTIRTLSIAVVLLVAALVVVSVLLLRR